MSHYDYKSSIQVEMTGASFYGIIMAAMRRADDQNLDKLRASWPEVWDELRKRYHAPGGFINGEDLAITSKE